MRGKVNDGVHDELRFRITPAYAGKSHRDEAKRQGTGDHPRICGEKLIIAAGIVISWGSPPHMRGKGHKRSAQLLSAGITPAYAGKSLLDCRQCIIAQDHPRICGEKPWRRFCAHWVRGSPPHMRGKAKKPPPMQTRKGITPAYAGKSLYFAPMICKAWDHPRICGEKLAALIVLDARAGSPPHMRGKGLAAGTWARWQRITPAYAGKSSCVSVQILASWDHPRICGEKLISLVFVQS